MPLLSKLAARLGDDATSLTINDPALVAQMLSVLECPVCFNYILPPIFQCSQGHLVCTSCRARMEKCPICRETLSDIRNLAMDRFATKVLFPCAHKNNGCNRYISFIDKFYHEKMCPYRMYECPFPDGNCQWFGSRRRIVYHLLKAHSRIAIWRNRELISLVNVLSPGIIIQRNNFGICSIQIDIEKIDLSVNEEAAANNALVDRNATEDAMAGGRSDLNYNVEGNEIDLQYELNLAVSSRYKTSRGRKGVISNKHILCKFSENDYFLICYLEIDNKKFEVLIPKVSAFQGEDMITPNYMP